MEPQVVPSLPVTLPADPAQGAALREGQVIRLRVAADLGNNEFLLQQGGLKLAVKSQTPLTTGSDITFRVQTSPQGMTLTPMTAAGVSAAAMDEVTVPAGFSLEVDAQLLQALVSDSSERLTLETGASGTVRLTTTDGQTFTARAVNVSADPAAGSPNAPAQVSQQIGNAAQMIVETVALTLILPDGSEAALAVDTAKLPVLLGQFAASGGSGTAQILSPDAKTNVYLALVGDVLGRISLPTGVTGATSVTANDLIAFNLGGSAFLSGKIAFSPSESQPQEIKQALQSLGIMPTALAVDAASALLGQGAALSRENLTALGALAAGSDPQSRPALLQAAAKLLAQDAPLFPALAAGLANVAPNAGGFRPEFVPSTPEILRQIESLVTEAGKNANIPAADTLAALNELAVGLEHEKTPEALAAYLKTFGREALAAAQTGIEAMAEARLASQPLMQKLDAAVTALLDTLNQASANTTTPAASAATSATAESAAALPTPAQAAASGEPPLPGATANTPAPSTLTPSAGLPAALPGLLLPDSALAQWTQTLAEAMSAVSGADPHGKPAQEAVNRVLREILQASTPAEAEQAARRFAESHPKEAAAHLANTLQEMERDAAQADPVTRRLAEAADGLRDLGRRAIAQKAEYLASLSRENPVLAAEIPFRFQGQDREGTLSLYYRRGRSKNDPYQARVVLDLQTESLGQVWGDLKDMGEGRLDLMFILETESYRDWLTSDAENLTQALSSKGFNAQTRFGVRSQLDRKTDNRTNHDDKPVPALRSHLDLKA